MRVPSRHRPPATATVTAEAGDSALVAGASLPGAPGPSAFVLGGGGVLGAAEVGMLRALLEFGVRPDLVLGTSVGALNGVFVAADPTAGAAVRLADLWSELAGQIFAGSLARRVGTAVRTGTSLHRPAPLRRLLLEHLPARTFADLVVPFFCVASCIERAAEHWFTEGPLVDAVLASAAVPGLLPPVEVGGEHFLDGGLVNSIPVGEAVRRGARTIWVLQVGRVERPLQPPRQPWQVASVAFEIARRHRFAADMADVPAGVDVHVLPTGAPEVGRLDDLRYRDTSRVAERVARAYDATSAYLAGLPCFGPVRDGQA